MIIRGDSKARHRMAHIHEDPYMNINYRGGSTINNNFLNTYTLQRIKRAFRPIVILWFGTCELTFKNGKYIRLAEDIDNKLQEIEHSYIAYKEKVLRVNSNSTVIFLECPSFSIPVWNRVKGHYYPERFDNEQLELEKAIKTLNYIIRAINGNMRVPKLSLDLEDSTKRRKNKPRKYYYNYMALTDGVHPGKDIARLWYLRIVKMISFL